MNKILLFAGTAEGRMVADFLRGTSVSLYVCAAAEHGAEFIQESKNVKVLSEPMDTSEIKYVIRKNGIKRVIDATHPLAREAAESIKKASKEMNVQYHRILRERDDKEPDAVYVETMDEAVAYLQQKEGHILIHTGSKELAKFTKLEHYKERCYARVQSTKESMAEGARLGFEGSHLIAMQGPFTALMNEAILRQSKAQYFVTTESGSTGGYLEKVSAAKKTGAKLVVVGRKAETEGQSVKSLCEELRGLYDIERGKMVYLVGIGTGNGAYLTERAKEILREADVVLGGKQIAAYAEAEGLFFQQAQQPKEISEFLKQHSEYENVAIALAGDASFYNGAKRLKKALREYEVEMIPGISLISYFAACMQTELENAAILSTYGKSCNYIGALRSTGRVFLLMESGRGVKTLCRELIRFGYDSIFMGVGTRLSYEDERIITGYPKDCMERQYEGLCVVYLSDPAWKEPIVSYGYEDEAYVRGDKPLIKSEVRSISISKMWLSKDSIIYDIGAGPGSVSVEMALQASDGMVYAIEREAADAGFIANNQVKFKASNIQAALGEAPEVFSELPMPTHAFIGESSGNLAEMIEALRKKNRQVRIVINAMTLDTLSECITYLKKESLWEEADITQVTIAKRKAAGASQVMTGQDAVYVVAFGGKK